MKKILLLCFIIFAYEEVSFASDKYDVVAILAKEDVRNNTMSIDKLGSYHEIEYILLPTKVDSGKYSVTLTRKGDNLYQIDGTDLYIRTKYCYTYCYRQDAVLVVHSSSYYSVGEVIFLD